MVGADRLGLPGVGGEDLGQSCEAALFRYSGGTDGAGRKAGMGRGTLSTLISLLDRCQQPSTCFEPPNSLAGNVVLRCDKPCEGSTSRFLRRQGCLVTRDVAVLPLSRCS